jgi:hypothetical protein
MKLANLMRITESILQDLLSQGDQVKTGQMKYKSQVKCNQGYLVLSVEPILQGPHYKFHTCSITFCHDVPHHTLTNDKMIINS